MILITKTPSKYFLTRCPLCGCEFLYEQQDRLANGKVPCPYCSSMIEHSIEKGISNREAEDLIAAYEIKKALSEER